MTAPISEAELDLIIQRMQDAVDIVLSSEHETSKVAACLFHDDGRSVAKTNHRPDALKTRFDWQDRIGKSSQFIHAEIACILSYEGSPEGGSLCVTDPFCPNCAKSIVESGVKRIFIDHKGMEKDFVKRRAGAFNLISVKIAQSAGVDVYILYRKERRLEALNLSDEKAPATYEGVLLENTANHVEALGDVVDSMECGATSYVSCLVRDRGGGTVRKLSVYEGLPPGLLPQDIDHIRPEDTDKYRFEIDPLNRLLFTLKRLDLDIVGGEVYCSHIPSSRGFVNVLLSSVSCLIIGSEKPDHDKTGQDVADIYQNLGVLKVETV